MMPKYIKSFGIAGGVAFVVAYILAGNAVRGLFKKSPDIRSQAFLSQVAAELNKTTPQKIDDETELASGTGLEGVFVYNYRLVNRSAGEVDGPKLAAILRPDVTKSACTTPQTRDTFLSKGVTLRYSYASKDGKPLTAFDVTPKDCGF